jgi:hypothetical protein
MIKYSIFSGFSQAVLDKIFTPWTVSGDRMNRSMGIDWIFKVNIKKENRRISLSRVL